ncbi:PREDICTED: uncharacterized protein LOC101390929 [Ceratotherium simum simum]|uniref:Uncharacterized protein LOC101390929 n=1 Tax=Ceratotherium simum simum TaxID=73337 RepID=A0ABM1D2R7_CERSS|nr:PREDICTED: uncharacterized protein LOC101390929 [Ceratotherium simum simum]
MSSPTETERCKSLIAVFQRYAGKDRNSSKLSKTEFPAFVNREPAAFTENQKDPGVLDCGMKKLDLNCDGQLDLQEFLNHIGGLATACHESFIKSTYSQSKSQEPLGLASIPAHLFSFQPPNHHLLLTAHTYPEPSTPATPCQPLLLLLIKQYRFLTHTHTHTHTHTQKGQLPFSAVQLISHTPPDNCTPVSLGDFLLHSTWS